jgi:hypothetical protein
MKEPSGLSKMLNRTYQLPDESFTYGHPLRPSTPMRNVLGNLYGDVAEQFMLTRYENMRMNTTQNRLPSSDRHTKASALAKRYIREKDDEESLNNSKILFKMKKFKNV